MTMTFPCHQQRSSRCPLMSTMSRLHKADNLLQKVYDVPPSQMHNTDLYDSPRKPGSVPNEPRMPEGAIMDTYDTLKKVGQSSGDVYDSPGYCRMKSIPQVMDSRRDSDHVYDIPPHVTKDKPLSGATLTRHKSVEEVESKMEAFKCKCRTEVKVV